MLSRKQARRRIRWCVFLTRAAACVQAVFKTCCKTLTAYCRNVYMNLEDPAKRRINGENKAFQQRVAAVDGGRDFLCEVGFQVRHCSHGHGPDSAAQNASLPPGSACEVLSCW